MPRKRQNDPLGVSDTPVTVQDPVREGELLEEYKARLSYIAESYHVAKNHLDDREFNTSLARLQRAVSSKKPSRRQSARLHPDLEMFVNFKAQEFARERGEDAKVEQNDVERAALHVTQSVKPRRGRPSDRMLRHHVEGLMALIQEMSGKPVRADRHKDSVYDPHFVDRISELIPRLFAHIDPDVTTTQLVNIVRDARSKFRGKPMRFADFFPAYGCKPQKDGSILLPDCRGHIEYVVNFPIYCP